MTKKVILILTIFLSSISLFAQEKTEVLLLATYHLGGTTSDNVKITNDNILSDKKQNEIDVLLKKIEKFKPQKIYVENEPDKQEKWDSILKSYNNGNKIKLETELFQVAIKLASRLKLSEITCVDWHVHTSNTFAAKKYNDLVKDMVNYENENIVGEEPESDYSNEALKDIISFNEKIPSLELIDAYRILNSEKYLDKIFYTNLTSFLDIDKYNINVFWSQKNMTRNVHIYQNIIRDIIKDKPNKVMILFGAAHIKALRNYLEAHPKIKIANTEKYLK